MRVLVTRPQPGTTATAKRLRADGYQPVMLPFSRIEPVEAKAAPQTSFDAVAATSAQALRWVDPGLLDRLRGRPFLAVGAKTALAARVAGFVDVREAEGDAKALVGLVGRTGVERLLYFCGRVRRPEFEAALADENVQVTPFETYDTLGGLPTYERLNAALNGRAPEVVLLYSAMAAAVFERLLSSSDHAALLRDTAVLALSPRVLDALPRLRHAFAAERPNEEALFALLAAHRSDPASFQPFRVC